MSQSVKEYVYSCGLTDVEGFGFVGVFSTRDKAETACKIAIDSDDNTYEVDDERHRSYQGYVIYRGTVDGGDHVVVRSASVGEFGTTVGDFSHLTIEDYEGEKE